MFRPLLIISLMWLLVLDGVAGPLDEVFALLDQGKAKEALDLAERSIKEGDADCAHYAGKAWLQGVGTDTSLPHAVDRFMLARELGSEEADLFLKTMRQKALGKKGSDEVRTVIQGAFDEFVYMHLPARYGKKRVPNGGVSLGLQRYAGRKLTEETLKILCDESLALHVASLRQIGAWLEDGGKGLGPGAILLATDTIEDLAEEGMEEAAYLLARQYSRGVFRSLDLDQALKLAEGVRGEEAQRLQISLLARMGNSDEAMARLVKLADEGSAYANRRLGQLHRENEQFVEAGARFRKAVLLDPDDWEAKVHLAELLVEGKGFSRDEELGLKLYEEAARSGNHPVAAYVAGMMHLRGIGTKPSISRAGGFLEQAAGAGVVEAIKVMKEIRESGGTESRNTTMPKPKPAAPAIEKSKVPPEPQLPRVHVVKAGDTFYELARDFGIDYEAFLKANPGIDPVRLRIGQELKLP